jgi:hypothetical protein
MRNVGEANAREPANEGIQGVTWKCKSISDSCIKKYGLMGPASLPPETRQTVAIITTLMISERPIRLSIGHQSLSD